MISTNEKIFSILGKKNKQKKIDTFQFVNKLANRKELENILSWTFRNYGIEKACILADLLKEIGFKYATKGGISISIEDLKVPRNKNQMLLDTKALLADVENKYQRGEVTETEWFQKRLATWNITSESIKSEILTYFEENDPLNPVYMMAFSGARGNISQIRQLIGMRGLMADQKGEIIGLPIQKNFREGLTIIDFIISSYGARKGIVDTAIRTADSGYLTRRLIDIAQDVIIRNSDCKTKNGIAIDRYHKDVKFKISFSERLLGRILARSIIDPNNQKIIPADTEINHNLAARIEGLSNIDKVYIRSPLTCQSSRSICQKCYGWDLAQAKLINIGEAIGIVAAQSIGEPGTQLTMRTFHTGGIFTAEVGQEISTTHAGQVLFAPNLQVHYIRTTHGEYAQLVEKSSYIEILTYTNKKIRINVARNTILLVKNNAFVKKNQVIGQIQLETNSEIEENEIKQVFNKFSGEISFQIKKPYNLFEYNTLVWVLAGHIYKLPFESKQNFKYFTNKNLIQSLGKTKLVKKFTDNTKRVSSITNNNIELSEPLVFLNDTKLFKNKNLITRTVENIQYILKDNKNNKINLSSKLTNTNIFKENLFIGEVIPTEYKTKTGGYLNNLNIELTSNKKNLYTEILSGGSLLWIPEESYSLNRDSAIVLVNNNSIVSSGTEISKNIFCKSNGLISLKEKTKIIQEISIKIAKIYSIKKDSIDIDLFIKYFENKFFFPGETLLDQIQLKTIIFTEINVDEKYVNLILRPVLIYQVSKPKFYKPKLKFQEAISNKLSLQYKKFLLFKEIPKNKIASDTDLTLLKTEVSIFGLENTTNNNNHIQLLIKSTNSDKNSYALSINNIQKFLVFDQLRNQIKNEEFITCFNVKKDQKIEPSTILGSFHIINSKNRIIYSSKSKFSKYQELLVTFEDQIKRIYFNETSNKLIKNEFFFKGDQLNDELVLKKPGKIVKKQGSLLEFQLAQPYLFSEGSIIQRNHGDLILKNEIIGSLVFKVLKTADIVQGLPKIEEILEARTPKNAAKLIEENGLLTKVTENFEKNNFDANILTLSSNQDVKKIAEVNETFNAESNLNLQKYQYLKLGQPIDDGSPNTHSLLNIYFNYYQKRDSLHKSTLRSFNKIASTLIEAIQSIYYSQGVRITDKHIEVILRQMMSRVKIKDAGNTPFLPGELINVKYAKLINTMLVERDKKPIFYTPVLLGLTKASLTTESFISAASFQETTRVLTQAAIEGKIDWLRGLKENVIVGNLIPAGSGFRKTSDLSKRFRSYKKFL